MSLELPKSKKQKVENSAAAAFSSAARNEDEEQESESRQPQDDSQEADGGSPAVVKRNDSNEAFFEISTNRRLTVREFKGKTLIDIREYYEKNGKALPGKKGISLNMEQYQVLRELIKVGDIDREIQELED